MENEQANAGRDGRNPSHEANFSGAKGTGKKHVPCSADHEQDWQLYLVDPYSAICDDHTCKKKNSEKVPMFSRKSVIQYSTSTALDHSCDNIIASIIV